MSQTLPPNQTLPGKQSWKGQRSPHWMLMLFPIATIGIVIGCIVGLQWAAQLSITLGYPTPQVQITTPSTNALTRQQSYQFSARGSGRDLTYSWDFGDQSGGETGITTNHAYETTGPFTVTVTATDPAGHHVQKSLSIDVLPTLPIASFTADAEFGDTVYFDASASSADSSSSITNYYWSFGDGTSDITGFEEENHSYANNGTYQVTLTVQDNTGQMSKPYTLSVTATTGF